MRLVKSKFEAWLRAKPLTEIVGHNRDCHTCPIAKYYGDMTGGCDIVIFDDGYGYKGDRGGGARALPWWASRFVYHVDGDSDGKITAGRALEVLEQHCD